AMLQTARHEDLVSAIMDFLTDEGAPPRPPPEASCLPFTLRDLIHTNLQSSVSMDAVVSALNLLRLILTRHCRYSPRLIEVERVSPAASTAGWMTSCTVAIDVHRQELGMYARLMVQLQGDASERRTAAAAAEAPALHIPWRSSAPPTPLGSRPPLEARSMMPEAFTAGYDAYLEDAALDWDGHCAYHSELSALFAAQAARDAALGDPPLLPPQPGRGPDKRRPIRPRKYSEAVAPAPAANAPPPPQRCTPAAGRPCAREHARYHVKPSDPTVRVLMNLLAKYFAQPRECNLALTGVLAALIGCPHRTLDLWLGFSLPALLDGVLSKPWAEWMDNLRNISDDGRGGNERASDSSDSEGECLPRGQHPGSAPAMALAAADASKYVGLDRPLQDAIRALPRGAAPPSLYLVINGLVQQAAVLRNEIPDFARRLRRARNALMGVVEDTDLLDEELEVSAAAPHAPTTQNRDRGLSSASLEGSRGAAAASSPKEPGLRDRSTSMSAERRASARARSNSAVHTSEAASIESASTTIASAARPAPTDSDTTTASPWHMLSVPPANASLPEFIENVIILQESIKEIIARVQVRRENGGDEAAVG
ncbi:hypothetical protein IWQ56_004412, partial [Coemansia nantahalensis]